MHMDWADTVDLRIFLSGFDAGEQWGAHMDSESRKRIQTPSWLLRVEEEVGFIPETVSQEIHAFNGEISDATPASIAEVNRNERTRQKL